MMYILFDWHVAGDVANWESFAIWRSWSKKEWLIRSNSCRRTAECFGKIFLQRNMLRVIWQAPDFGLLVVKVWNRHAFLFSPCCEDEDELLDPFRRFDVAPFCVTVRMTKNPTW